MVLAALYFLMIYKIPLPPQNLVVPSHSKFENRKVWTDLAKNIHKIRYVERVELDVSLVRPCVRLELNKISTLPEFKTFIIWDHSRGDTVILTENDSNDSNITV